MRRKIPKPFSELSRPQQIAVAQAAIERLSHPHNAGSRECYEAIRRWRETLARLGAANVAS